MNIKESHYKAFQAMTTRPGKYEFEQPLTPYLNHISNCNGDGEQIASIEDDGHFAASFELTTDEWEMFSRGDDDFSWHWILVQDSQGFVMTMSPEKYQTWKG